MNRSNDALYEGFPEMLWQNTQAFTDQALSMKNSEAVSYTHLTLPTIYSV